MPTGYTAELMEKGMEFKPFVLQCARAFGALVLMRDAPMDAPIPEKFEPSDYNIKYLARAQEKHKTLSAMTNDERVAFGQAEKEKAVKSAYKKRERYKIQNERLSEMQSQVMAWKPPTPDHEGLKNFMREQIEISMNNLGYIEKRIEASEIKSPTAFYVEAVSESYREIEYHSKENAKEIERAESRTKWVNELRKSLGIEGGCND